MHFHPLLLRNFCLLLTFGLQAAEFDLHAHYVKHEYRIPMRDGTKLFTAVYSPKDTLIPYPILLTRTPYGIGPYGVDQFPKALGPADGFEQEGFVFVYQDVRGRFMSEGTWLEMTPERDNKRGPNEVDESSDTYDTIDWLIKNVPGNNGKVGLVGISYPGFYASAGMIGAHPALIAVSPQAPVSDLYMGDDAYHNGALFLTANFNFYADFSKQNNPALPQPTKPFRYGTEDGYRFFLDLSSLSSVNEKLFKFNNPYWTDLVKHTNYDDFWKARNILPHLRHITPAVLVVGGWYDAEDLAGTLNTFRAIEQNSPETREWLVIGPWEHGGWAHKSESKLGSISFGSNTADFFRAQIELPFFRHYLKGAPDPELPKAYVFETGDNIWSKLAQWPPANTTIQRLYFHANGLLSSRPPTELQGADEYMSDPNDPVPFLNKKTVVMAREYMNADQKFARGRSDVLSYQTTPLDADVTLAGPVLPSLFVSSSGTDSDFIVKLIDVHPDDEDGLQGYEELVRGEPFRGKFRNSFEAPEPFIPGKIEQVHFSMPDIYHCFRRRHRIMVQVQSSWFPLIDRNPQTFTDIPNAQPADFQKALERIYRSSANSSYVEVHSVEAQP